MPEHQRQRWRFFWAPPPRQLFDPEHKRIDMVAGDTAAASEEPGAMKAEQFTGPIRSPSGEEQAEAKPSVHVLSPPFAADGGAAWMIALPAQLRAAADTDDWPNRSPLLLLENGAPLGPGHALHSDIREKGQGRYSFWKTELWFSTADGSDPNRNGRVYAIAHVQRPELERAPQSAPLFAGGFVARPVSDPPVHPDGVEQVVPAATAAAANCPETSKIDGGKPIDRQLNDVTALDKFLVDQMRAILDADGADASGFYEYYQIRLQEGQGVLSAYDRALVDYIADNFVPADCRIVHAGIGVGQLTLALAVLGYNIAGIERDTRRFTAVARLRDAVSRVWPDALPRYTAIEGEFPEILLGTDWIASDVLLIFTNCTAGWSDDLTDKIIGTFPYFGHVILDARVFGLVRDTHDERESLIERIREHGLSPRLISGESPLTHYYHIVKPQGEHSSIGGRGYLRRYPDRGILPTIDVPTRMRDISDVRVSGRCAGSPVFSVFGDLRLSQCPVCRSSTIAPLWRIPMATLQEPIQVFGEYFDQIPTMEVPSLVYCFDLCGDCESIFLNPVSGKQKEQYRTTEHYVRKMETAAEWQRYEDIYDSFAKWIPADATVMVDAACGVGQYLHVARQRRTHAWRRMVGLELAESYVRYMHERGFEAYAFDLDNDDLAPLVEPGSVDFITFCEAFEHVERPLDALRKLVAALRPGGRLYLTAQRYGADVQAAVQPGKPIYIGEKVVAQIPKALGCQIVSLSTSSMRYFIVLEK